MPAGRPTDYSAEALATAKGAYLMGATDVQVAGILGVSEATIYNWKTAHPEFLEASKMWKAVFDDKVELALGQRAIGYSHADTDIRVIKGKVVLTPITKHYPPSEAAAIFWLKNRRRGDWRDRIDHNVTGSLGQLTDEQVEERHQELLRKAAAEKDAGK